MFNFTFYQAMNTEQKIIIRESLPEKWSIEITEKNIESINEVVGRRIKQVWNYTLKIGWVIHCEKGLFSLFYQRVTGYSMLTNDEFDILVLAVKSPNYPNPVYAAWNTQELERITTNVSKEDVLKDRVCEIKAIIKDCINKEDDISIDIVVEYNFLVSELNM